MSDLNAIIEKLDACTTTELGDLVPKLEELWGVESSYININDFLTSQPEVVEEEQTEFDVMLMLCDAGNRIAIIKELRQITNMPLKEARDAIDNLPYKVVEAVSRERADELKTKFESVGGSIEIR